MKLSMRMRIRPIVALSAVRFLRGLAGCIFVFAVSLQAEGQETYRTFGNFDELYATIFPRITDEFDANHEFAIDVRLRPSFSAPRQLTFSKDRNGKLTAYIYNLANENESIGDQVNSLIRRGVPDDVKTLSRQLKVSKTAIRDPEFLVIAVKDFFEKTSFRKETGYSLDGVGYDVWYVDSGNRIYLSLVGGEKFEKGESPVITWVRNLFRALDRSKRQKPT